ncbi:MAG: phage head-tail connector protein [Lawsonibacter sp.]
MEERLSWLKTVLGIEDTAQDGLLTFVLQTVEERILAYLSLDTLPVGLERAEVLIAASYWKGGGLGNDQAAPGAVTSVSRGDVSTTFAAPEGGTFGLGSEDSFFGWRATLDTYRQLRRNDGG